MLDLEHSLENLTLSIRIRMAAGADVEPGALVAISEKDAINDAEGFDQTEKPSSANFWGLSIYKFESFIKHERLEAKILAEKR
jgi:hypothetical protein